MGCVCFKDNNLKNSYSNSKLYTSCAKFSKCLRKNCRCFVCFKNKKNNIKYTLDKDSNVKEGEDNKSDINLVHVAFPSVKINDIETPIEKLTKTFSGVYMRDKGLNVHINSNYIDKENTRKSLELERDSNKEEENVIVNTEKEEEKEEEITDNTDNN